MFEPVETGDGSSTFYSERFGEWFHSREGACDEAQRTYVETAQIQERVQQQTELKIFDVCYGLGYNTAAALAAIELVTAPCPVEIVGLELEIEVARSAIAHNLLTSYSPWVQQTLSAIATQDQVTSPALTARLITGDARQTIQPLVQQGWQADVIFLDPFSPPHCPQLWTVEFLQLVAQCLKPEGGVLITYSCAAAVRAALQLAGLSIGSFQAAGRQWPGTIAHYDSKFLAPLSQQEQEHLQTRAAVPYRDPTLQAMAEEILAQRAKAQANSSLMPTGPWRKRWKENWRLQQTASSASKPADKTC